jgi:hypothetical protein
MTDMSRTRHVGDGLYSASCAVRVWIGFLNGRSRWRSSLSNLSAGGPWLGVKLRGKKAMAITTYRCVGCGYVESYAR